MFKMLKSYARILRAIVCPAMFLSIGVVSAADVLPADSVDSRSATGFAQEKDQARHRQESQSRRQADGRSAGDVNAPGREQQRSMEQERRKVQMHSQQRPRPRDVDRRGMPMGAGGPGGGRR